MKNKFIAKLVLSGAALAVSAVTLVSTTYAWYVQNTQVTATGVSGSVKDNNATSLFIAKDVTYDSANSKFSGTWGQSVAFNSDDYDTTQGTANKVFNGALDPVTRNASGDFVDVKNTIGDSAARVVQFTLYVQSNVASTTGSELYIRPYLRVKNTTSGDNVHTQTAYRDIAGELSGSSTTLATEGNQFWIDAVQALRMEINVSKANSSSFETDKFDAISGSKKVYDVLSVAYNDDVTNYLTTAAPNYTIITTNNGLTEANFADEDFYFKTTDIALVSGKTYYTLDVSNNEYNAVGSPNVDYIGTYYEKITLKGANAYYYGLVGSVPTAGFTEVYSAAPATSGKIDRVEIDAANTAYKFDFTIWLEGTDAACFDSCAKQTFNFAVDFVVEEGNS